MPADAWLLVSRGHIGTHSLRWMFGFNSLTRVSEFFRKIYYLNIDELYKLKKNKKKAKKTKQGKSEGFDSCDRPSNLTQIGFKSSIFQPVWPWNLMQINEI